jgi:general secretion pathway protein L
VQLSPELVLRRRLTLPLAVEHRLGDALALQMDRHVPLRADLAHLDHRVVERHPARAALTAEIAMAHRMRLDPVLAMLKGAGFQIDRVGLAADPIAEVPLNFLRSEAKTRETKIRRVQAALFGFLLLLALAGQNLVTLKQASEVEALQARIDALDPDVKKAHALSGELSRLQDEQRLAATGKAEFDVLGVLNDLSARIPDGSWLTNLELLRSASEARLTGFSGDATALLSTLEASPLLTEARLRGPVTKDQQGRERFEAVVHIGATRKP